MNVYGIIIIVALLLDYGLSSLAKYLNIRGLRDGLPPEFADVFDKDAYRRSQRYSRDKAVFGFITSTVGLAILLTFWFAGGFPWLDTLLRGLSLPDPVMGAAYLLILITGSQALMMPFDVYRTFVLEERYGFNKTTAGTFITDKLKGLALMTLVGGPLMALILALFGALGGDAWLLCWGVVAVFIILMQFILPSVILPLFYSFTPLEDGPLRERILEYADTVSFPVADVYVVDGSRRSTKANAFFTGFGRMKRIALFDTLIENHTTDELLTVLAHEVGHFKKKHVLLGIALSILHIGALLFVGSQLLFSPDLYAAFSMDGVRLHAGFVFISMLLIPADIIVTIALNSLSRHNERQADRFASATTGNTDAFISALKKLSRNNLTNLRPHPLAVILNYSHPPVLQRIKVLR